MSQFHRENEKALIEGVEKMIPMLQEAIKKEGLKTVMEKIYENADGFSKQTIEAGATCKQGCSFCCYDTIPISMTEAKYLENKFQEPDVEVKPNVLALVKQQNNIFSTLDWKDKRCSLLGKDNNCTIYENRPLICRTHNSTEKAEMCIVDSGGKSENHGQYYSMDIEIIQATLMLMSQGKTTMLHKIL